MSPAEIDRALSKAANELLAVLKVTGPRDERLILIKRRLKQHWKDGWEQGRKDEAAARRAKRKDSSPRELNVAGNEPPSPEDQMRERLEELDPVTKSWAPLIAPSICQMQQGFRIPMDEVVDWIYSSAEPVSVFEFCDWARDVAEALQKKASA
jgi:hypothetical protein